MSTREYNLVADRKDFLVYGSPLIEEEEIREVAKTVESAWLGTGPKVHQFEQMFRDYKQTEYSMALYSCTAGLHLSMLALDLKPGDEVITTTMTFCATVNAIIHSGATPILVDCEKDTMNIDPAKIEAKITSKTKAIVVVHFAGRVCNMDEIMKIVRKYNLKLIEDCAHAIEAEYHGKKTGSFGDLACYSFYATKNIVTGEGGMVTTNIREYAEKIKILGLHGMSKDAWKRFSDSGYKHYEVVYPGYKYNMMDIQAAIGIHQLPRVDKYWLRRHEIWNRYQKELAGLPIDLPKSPESNTRHSYHLFPVLVRLEDLNANRDDIINALTKENIGVGVHYIAVHLHPYYQHQYGYRKGDFPNAEDISERTISIPLSPKLSDRDVQDVIHAIKKVLDFYSK